MTNGHLSSLTQAVENGYRVPAVLKTNPWLSELRREGRLDALLEQAEAGRREASASSTRTAARSCSVRSDDRRRRQLNGSRQAPWET